MNQPATYPIGTPGVPWGADEVARSQSCQVRKRSYQADVLSAIDALRTRFDVVEYGRMEVAGEHYPLLAIKSRDWHDTLPVALVTGGVHGYETSGVHGALRFADQHLAGYAGRANLMVAPCVSPWAYETIQRWNREAVDPNRSFREPSPAPESAALMRLMAPLRDRVLVHVDLHETTDSDESEFPPGPGGAGWQTLPAGCGSRRLLRGRRQRTPASGIPAGGDRRGGGDHPYRADRSQGRNHRLNGGRARRHPLSAETARAVRRNDRCTVEDHHQVIRTARAPAPSSASRRRWRRRARRSTTPWRSRRGRMW